MTMAMPRIAIKATANSFSVVTTVMTRPVSLTLYALRIAAETVCVCVGGGGGGGDVHIVNGYVVNM